MVEQETTLDDHSDLSRRLLIDIENFVDEIGHRGCTTLLDDVLTDGCYLKGKQLGQLPERFIEDHLIFPVLETLGHNLLPRPVQYAPRWSHGRGIPDFALTTVPVEAAKQHNVRLFGEAKAPNKLKYAQEDVEDYLNKDLDFHAVAILTDGIDWELWIRARRKASPISTPHTRWRVSKNHSQRSRNGTWSKSHTGNMTPEDKSTQRHLVGLQTLRFTPFSRKNLAQISDRSERRFRY